MAVRAPTTVTQTSHAVVILLNNEVIGAISQWNPTMSREGTLIYELGNGETQTNTPMGVGPGDPFERIPGNVTGLTIELQRYDLYKKKIEELIPGQSFDDMLSQQIAWFTIAERWAIPTNSPAPVPAIADGNFGAAYRNEYLGCWFERVGRTIATNGDRIVQVSATIGYTRKRKVRT